jgi:undecaprenyl-diphosphatase
VTHLQAAVLGVVQGVTEFLPVSSSAHLILAPRLLGWPDQGLGFDAVMHIGTLAALLVYFRDDLWRMVRGMDRRLAVLLVAATVPAGLAGLLLEKIISSRLRNPLIIAATMVGWALVMWVADRVAGRRLRAVKSPADVGWGAGMTVGLAQVLALVPGTSRSGVTITAGLFAGMSRPTAARFAFLLGIPITAAAGGLKTLSFLHHGADPAILAPLATGLVASFVAGLAAVWFLVNFLETRSLTPFVMYRCALGIVLVILFAS